MQKSSLSRRKDSPPPSPAKAPQSTRDAVHQGLVSPACWLALLVSSFQPFALAAERKPGTNTLEQRETPCLSDKDDRETTTFRNPFCSSRKFRIALASRLIIVGASSSGYLSINNFSGALRTSLGLFTTNVLGWKGFFHYIDFQYIKVLL